MTDDMQATAGVIAGIVALLALVPYAVSIVRGKTKPNRASWFIWTFVGLMIVGSYHASGATHTMWVAGAYVAVPLTVALLSIRYGTSGAHSFDWLCLGLSLASIVPWWFFRSAPTALYINIFVDCLGALPTVRKALLDPQSEDRLAWLIAFLANCINLLAIHSWTPEISAYPMYAFAITGLIASILYLRQRAPVFRVCPSVGSTP